jgi:hypothetical protein
MPDSLQFYIYYALFFIAVLYTVFNFRKTIEFSFTRPVLLLVGAMLISAFSATFFWSQGILDSFMALPLYLSYVLFFLLIVWKEPVDDIESVIIVLGVIYLIVYSVTFFSFPTPVFGNIESFSTDRGFQRVMLEGRGFLFLFSFYALGRFYRKRELLWLGIFIITVIGVMMLLTRTLIAGSLILWTMYILRKSKYINKVIAVIFIIGFVYLISQLNFSQLLFKQTMSQTENFNDYIRVKAVTFYLTEFSPNIYAKVFGNGEPFRNTGYANYINYIEKMLGLYTSDIGYIGMYSKFGLLSVIAYIALIIGTFKIEVQEEYLYAKYFLYFVFVISIIIDSPFSSSFISSIVLALYILSSQDLSKVPKEVVPQTR